MRKQRGRCVAHQGKVDHWKAPLDLKQRGPRDVEGTVVRVDQCVVTVRQHH